MRIVLHVGMPKAGSTSIQSAMLAHADLLLRHGISYAAGDPDFTSDHELYELTLTRAAKKLTAMVDAKLAAAEKQGATTTVFSAERLFTLALQEPELSCLLDVFRSRADDLEIVVVVRAIERFLRSYLRQLIDNGMFYLDDLDQAAWCAACVRTFWELPERVTAIALRESDPGANLVATFFDVIGAPATVPDAHENVSSRRSSAFHTPVGIASRIFALMIDEDVNSAEVDDFRIALAREYDEALAEDHTGGGLRVLNSLSEIVDVALDQYIAFSTARVGAEDRELVESLLAQETSVNS